MQLGFVTVRPYLDNEFTKAEWDTDSGLGSKDLHDKVLLYMNQNKDMPFPILKAKTLEIVAEYAQFQINPKSIFADKINVGINYEKTASNSLYENIFRNRYDSILRNSISCEWEKRDVAIKMGICSPETDFWHMLPDWESIFSLGFAGLLKRAEKAKINLRKANTTRVTGKNKVNIHKINTYENDIFYDSVIITYKAFLLYIRRLYSAAIKLHLTEYAECLDYISKYPPKTLYHVLQMTHLFLSFGEIGMERVRSLGLVDRLYYPYYLSDLRNGIYTIEEIKEMFRYFFVKFSAAKRFANQPLAIGGTYADGADAFNELTLLMLDIYEELNIHNPKFHVRCHDKMPDTLLRKLLYMIRKGNSSIVLINDATVYKGYDKIGISRELSVKYVPIGCYEPVIMGVEDARIGASWINIVKAVEFAMHGGIDSLTGKVFGYKTNMEFDSFDGFYKVFIGHLDYIIEFTINNILKQQDYQLLINPSPFYSGTIKSCIKWGRDIFNNGMEIRNTSIKCFGIATAVDSLLAVKKFVFDDKCMSLAELSSILRNNWKGHEILRLKIKNGILKFGNNLEEPDQLACEIYNFIAKKVVNRSNNIGGVFRLGTDSIHLNHFWGRLTGATPDGRFDREPLSKNMRPGNGMEREGITGYIQSVTKLNHEYFLDAAVLDFVLHQSAVQGNKGLDALTSLVKVYFRQGGFAIQGNVVDIKTLKDAQIHPEEYQNLQVRVCGWNECFINLSKEVQDDFITRTGRLV